MSTIDFTQALRESEKAEARRMEQLGIIYSRVTSDAFIPGVEIEMFVNPLNGDDVLLSPRSACQALGLGANWLNTSLSRPRIMAKLQSFGMGEKKVIDVAHYGNLVKNSVAIDKTDFSALLRYAVEAKKPMAVAISGAFIGLGLISSAGLGDLGSEEVRDRFRYFLGEMLESQQAGGSNVSK